MTVSGTPVAAVPGHSLTFNLFSSLRPGQWTRNLRVFAGLLFRRRLFDAVPVSTLAACAIYR
jgi:hypothetical protein